MEHKKLTGFLIKDLLGLQQQNNNVKNSNLHYHHQHLQQQQQQPELCTRRKDSDDSSICNEKYNGSTYTDPNVDRVRDNNAKNNPLQNINVVFNRHDLSADDQAQTNKDAEHKLNETLHGIFKPDTEPGTILKEPRAQGISAAQNDVFKSYDHFHLPQKRQLEEHQNSEIQSSKKLVEDRNGVSLWNGIVPQFRDAEDGLLSLGFASVTGGLERALGCDSGWSPFKIDSLLKNRRNVVLSASDLFIANGK